MLSSIAADPAHYAGAERDVESGMDVMGTRYYSSSTGRFLTPDRLGGHLEDPQTLNKYSYVANNPLSRTDPSGMDFYLSCTQSKDNTSNCQSQQIGTDSKGNAITATVQGVTENGIFTATQIGNDKDGNLIDKTTGTGTYTGSFDGKTVTFTNSLGQQSTGDWVQGTNRTDGITGGGDLGSRFQFEFMNHGPDQALNFDWQFNGTLILAEAILQRAGYKYFSWGADSGYDEFRLPTQGRDSTHFLVEQSPKFTLPSANGHGHSGEYYPGSLGGVLEHWWNDVR